jgi:hypothetical protein
MDNNQAMYSYIINLGLREEILESDICRSMTCKSKESSGKINMQLRGYGHVNKGRLED